MRALLTARVRDVFLRKPFYVDGERDVVAVCRLMAQHGASHALVRDAARIGIFTTTDLRDALLRPVPPAELAVREVARFELVCVAPDAPVVEALLLMLQHRVHRVIVRDGDAAIVGVLGQLDLLAFISNHSHLIALQIEQADSVAELAQAAPQVDALVAQLHIDGMRVEIIARLVCELNRQLFARAWALLAPAELVANSCLIVMGSEGRGEQILKTDQDNALLLRDGYAAPAELASITARFTAALLEFGYPRCPGGVMLSEAPWCQPLTAFKAQLRDWMFGADADGAWKLAIFLDAQAVAGDATLLQQARGFVDAYLVDSDAFFARFARAVDQFAEPAGWRALLAGLRGHAGPATLDLKKLGIFPIVHGTRALALQYHVEARGSAARLQALAERGHLAPALARDLTDALHALMALRLDHHLRQRGAGAPLDNLVHTAALGTLERDRLHDALAIVKRFRQHLQLHYRFDTL